MALLAILVYSSARLDPLDSSRTLFGWTSGLLGLQGACLILYISGRVSTAVRQDIQTRIIESHRLMPLPPMHAVAGYITGAAAQPLIFSGGLFLVGGIAATAGGVSMSRWAFANLILLAFSASLWVAAAYAAFGSKFGGFLIFFPILIPYMSQGGVLVLLPGLTVLLSPIIGSSIFDLRTGGLILPATYAISFAAGAYFATILFIAAARKYLRSDAIGVDSILGLCLIAGWTAVSWAGLREWDDFRPRGWHLEAVTPRTQVIASMIVGLLCGVFAVAANAMERVRWRRHERLRDPAAMKRPLPLSLVLVIATVLILIIPFGPDDSRQMGGEILARSAACILIALLGLYFLFDWIYSAVPRAGMVVFIWILIAWGAPILIDIVRYNLGDFGEAEPIAGFSTCSPVGALIVLWNRSVVDTLPGIFVQLGVAAIPGTLWMMSHLKRTRAGGVGVSGQIAG
jgi:hypothetical protein